MVLNRFELNRKAFSQEEESIKHKSIPSNQKSSFCPNFYTSHDFVRIPTPAMILSEFLHQSWFGWNIRKIFMGLYYQYFIGYMQRLTFSGLLSYFIPPENTRKPKVFWCFQGVWNRNLSQKCVKKNLQNTALEKNTERKQS